MLEAEIPKDIRKYESKLVLMFTTRQVICLVVAAVIGFIVYSIAKVPMGKVAASYLCFFISIPEVLIGWVKIQGIPFEKFVRTAFVSNVLASSKRLYKTKNPYKKAVKPIKVLSEKELKKRRKKMKALIEDNPKYTPLY